jgi:hypothetical protein
MIIILLHFFMTFYFISWSKQVFTLYIISTKKDEWLNLI